MKWHYKTDLDFKWPEKNEKVLLGDFNGAVWVSYFNGVNIDTIEAWASIEPPKMVRWKPGYKETYWSINSLGACAQNFWSNDEYDTSTRCHFGVHKTEEEAKVMFQKIKDFVTKEIGEV